MKSRNRLFFTKKNKLSDLKTKFFTKVVYNFKINFPKQNLKAEQKNKISKTCGGGGSSDWHEKSSTGCRGEG